MFQLNPGALDAEMQRRHELATAAMHAVHGTTMERRVAGVVHLRHAVATLVIGAIAFVR